MVPGPPPSPPTNLPFPWGSYLTGAMPRGRDGAAPGVGDAVDSARLAPRLSAASDSGTGPVVDSGRAGTTSWLNVLGAPQRLLSRVDALLCTVKLPCPAVHQRVRRRRR